LIDKQQKMYQAYGAFLIGFITDLNHLSEDGWAVLVEGKRDERALRSLGFRGQLVSVTSVGRKGLAVLEGFPKVVILTDLDREGGVLAARYAKKLTHEGLKTSLVERRRLKHASHGVFLHIENLSRFAEPLAI
jgi:5S rRNA maturation endonuclease (ribonuclease M5)